MPKENKMPKRRVLCINPWIYDFTAYDLWSKPLGLLYIASFLRQRGVAVDFIDCLDRYHPALLKRLGRDKPKVRKYGIGPFHREIVPTPAAINFIPRHYARYGLPEDIFIAELKNKPVPDAILITSFMTYWYPGVKAVVEICRKVFPGKPILLGGIYASLLPGHAREVIQPDFLVQDPGEIKVAEVLADLWNLPELIADLPTHIDQFPYPAFELYHKLGYFIVMSSRGCPFRCTFCATYKINANFSQRSPDQVVREIMVQYRKLGVRDVAFYDDALLMQPDLRIKPLLRSIREAKLPLRFHTPNGLHARFIDEELAELMYGTGFKTIRLSLESVARERLRDIHNKVTPGEMTRAVQNLTRAGFKASQLETYVIMGLPAQPLEEVIETMLYANSLGVLIRLASFSPIPGTVDYQKAVQEGMFPEDADPLLTNKTLLPLFRTREAYEKFRLISQFASMLNDGARKGMRLARPGEFRDALIRALNRLSDGMDNTVFAGAPLKRANA